MRLWTLIKIVAGAAVISIGTYTFLLVWGAKVKPVVALPGVSNLITPEAKPVAETEKEGDPKAPELDPGIKIFEKARESIAMGDLPAARERLNQIVTTYPRSKSAPEARRIVGEMNMDDVLSPANMEGKATHVVQKGESFLLIAAKRNTTIDCIMHLNGMLELASLHPGDELVVMPLDFKLLIEPTRKSLSVWKGDQFVKEYNLISAETGGLKATFKTSVGGTYGMASDRKVSPATKGYRESQKIISLVKSSLQIRGEEPEDNNGPAAAPGTIEKGFILAPPDAEELSLIVRQGNEVEIRLPAP